MVGLLLTEDISSSEHRGWPLGRPAIQKTALLWRRRVL